MKNVTLPGIIAKAGVLVLAFAIASCGTTPAQKAASGRSVGGFVPDFVTEALMSVPEDALVGIGTAKLASLNQSMTVAQTRARADISRQLNTVIREMITDYTASAETDPSAALSFQETITTALSQSTLQGATVVNMDQTESGDFWVVVMLTKSNAATEIANAAESARRLTPGANAAMWAQDRMDAALGNNAKAPLQVADTDTAQSQPVQPVQAEQTGPAPVQTLPAQVATSEYSVGDTGPAGGIVFYDKGNSAGGWRYLEAADSDTGTAAWATRYQDTARGEADEPGSGLQNTEMIMDFVIERGVGHPAAQMCSDYSQGGFSDWYLPSRSELNLMYTNMKLRNIGILGNGTYWSSSGSGTSVQTQNFRDGSQGGEWANKTYSVRPIRRF